MSDGYLLLLLLNVSSGGGDGSGGRLVKLTGAIVSMVRRLLVRVHGARRTGSGRMAAAIQRLMMMVLLLVLLLLVLVVVVMVEWRRRRVLQFEIVGGHPVAEKQEMTIKLKTTH